MSMGSDGGSDGDGQKFNISLNMQKVEATLANLLKAAYTIQQAILTQFGNLGVTGKHYMSAASNNSTNVTAVSTILYNANIVNSTATIYYFKLYDKATAPTVGTDIPVGTYACVANAMTVVPLNAGQKFLLGLGFGLVANIADADNTNAATGLSINLGYS